MQCVVLAGGLGTRLEAVANGLPKHLIPVSGAPFADLQLSWLAGEGVDRVTYCIAHRGEAIRDHVGDGSRWGVAVDYVDEGLNRRGTGGALGLAATVGALEDRFLVIYGDSFLQVSVQAVWNAFRGSARPAIMTIYRNEGRFGPSNVRYGPGEAMMYDKFADEESRSRMDYIDYGLLGFERQIIAERFADGATGDLAEFCHELSVRGLLAGYEVAERFYEVGTPDSLRELEQFVESAQGGSRG